VELPTYTSIWRIEKRLYKLYDFRLPMPLPVGQIAVFAAVTVPYIVLLTLFGLPFNHNLFWLYVLPPGLLTWLATRPVLESKRLPELIISQARYIGEPSTWCRMAPLAEKDEIVVFGRVWRRVSVAPAVTAEQEGIEQRGAARELPVPERAALPVAAAAAQGISGQPVTEQPVPGSAGTIRRSRSVRERHARERQAREQQARERAPTGPAQGQRVREPAEQAGTRWGRRAAGTMRRQAAYGPAVPGLAVPEPGLPGSAVPGPGVPGSAVPGPEASGQAVSAREAQRPPAADAGWARAAGPAADAAVRRDPGAAAPPRVGRHAGPARPASAAGSPAGNGVRPSDPGAEPRHAGEAVPGSGAGPVGYAGRVGGTGPAGHGDRSASRDRDLGVAGAAGLIAAIGYAAGSGGRPAQDISAGYSAGAGEAARNAGPVDGAAATGAVGYAAGAGRPARDSGPGEETSTGWPAGNGAGAGVPSHTDSGHGPDTIAGIGWPVGSPAATSAPPSVPARGAGPAGYIGLAREAGWAADTGPAAGAGPSRDSGPDGGTRPGQGQRGRGAAPVGAEPWTAGPDAAGPDAAGLDAAGLDAAGPDAAGADAAGTDAAGPDAAGPEQAGPQPPPEPPAPPPLVPQSSAPQAPVPQPSALRPLERQPPAPPSAEPPPSVPPSADSRPPAPVTIVPAQRSVAGPPPPAPARPRPAPVERALSGPGERRSGGWQGHVTVVPGGRGPGRPDHVKEARSRAVLPLDRPRLVVVLGCTVGAGQTVTALMLADLLAGLRGEPVAALDLNPGPASLTELARVPAITVGALLADRAPGAHAAHRGPDGPARGHRTRGRLDVICQDADAEGDGATPGLQLERVVGVLSSRYMLTLADPGAPAVAKMLAEAGQLVLVAPASPDAARAVSMTCEWLSGHGHATLGKHSIAVLNGVSPRSVRHAEQAELVLRGRCRAIVRVPWDDHLAEPEAERGIRVSLEAADGQARLARLRPAVLQAYTALAGVLVSSLADDPTRRKAAR
jgi:MinD-like ATPase involved in chromosome partitioning or flagellar assembly